MTANSGLPIVNPEDMSRVWHFAIQAMPDEDDIELALEYLEELAERSSRAVPRSVVKITGQKLNQKGLVKSIDKLLGKTILIEDAADMNERVINEFCKIIDPTDRSLLVVFIKHTVLSICISSCILKKLSNRICLTDKLSSNYLCKLWVINKQMTD